MLHSFRATRVTSGMSNLNQFLDISSESLTQHLPVNLMALGYGLKTLSGTHQTEELTFSAEAIRLGRRAGFGTI